MSIELHPRVGQVGLGGGDLRGVDDGLGGDGGDGGDVGEDAGGVGGGGVVVGVDGGVG